MSEHCTCLSLNSEGKKQPLWEIFWTDLLSVTPPCTSSPQTWATSNRRRVPLTLLLISEHGSHHPSLYYPKVWQSWHGTRSRVWVSCYPAWNCESTLHKLISRHERLHVPVLKKHITWISIMHYRDVFLFLLNLKWVKILERRKTLIISFQQFWTIFSWQILRWELYSCLEY